MSVTSTVILIIGILALIESLFALLLPKVGVKILKKMNIMKRWQNTKAVKKAGLIELIIAIILILIGMNM